MALFNPIIRRMLLVNQLMQLINRLMSLTNRTGLLQFRDFVLPSSNKDGASLDKNITLHFGGERCKAGIEAHFNIHKHEKSIF